MIRRPKTGFVRHRFREITVCWFDVKLDCIKSRKRPLCDIEIGHRSTSPCLLSNVAYRSKERLAWDVPNQKMIQGSAEAKKLLSREYRAPWKLTV